MPELPEVEYARRLLSHSVLERTIYSVWFDDPGCETNIFYKGVNKDVILEGNDGGTWRPFDKVREKADIGKANMNLIRQLMLDSKIVDVRRKGKNLVVMCLKRFMASQPPIKLMRGGR